MNIKISERKINVIDVDSLLSLIKEQYGIKNFEISDWINLCEGYFDSDGAFFAFFAKAPVPEEMPSKIGNHSSLGCILNDLVLKGVLKPGVYHIWREA